MKSKLEENFYRNPDDSIAREEIRTYVGMDVNGKEKVTIVKNTSGEVKPNAVKFKNAMEFIKFREQNEFSLFQKELMFSEKRIAEAQVKRAKKA